MLYVRYYSSRFGEMTEEFLQTYTTSEYVFYCFEIISQQNEVLITNITAAPFDGSTSMVENIKDF